jgi:hypothetical protein
MRGQMVIQLITPRGRVAQPKQSSISRSKGWVVYAQNPIECPEKSGSLGAQTVTREAALDEGRNSRAQAVVSDTQQCRNRQDAPAQGFIRGVQRTSAGFVQGYKEIERDGPGEHPAPLASEKARHDYQAGKVSIK